ncbi:unnamed protein product [Boreogadus saida]
MLRFCSSPLVTLVTHDSSADLSLSREAAQSPAPVQSGDLRTAFRLNGSTSRMRTLDSGIGTIPLPESCSFFSSLLHLLPRSTSSPVSPVSPVSPGAPGSSSSEEVSATSTLPRWKCVRVPQQAAPPLSRWGGTKEEVYQVEEQTRVRPAEGTDETSAGKLRQNRLIIDQIY